MNPEIHFPAKSMPSELAGFNVDSFLTHSLSTVLVFTLLGNSSESTTLQFFSFSPLLVSKSLSNHDMPLGEGIG